MELKKMSACYYPTTTVLVDDDPGLIGMVSRKISRMSPCKAYSSPIEALDYISHRYDAVPFNLKFFSSSENFKNTRRKASGVAIDTSSITKFIYDQKRFTEVSAFLVDYAMPGLDGREFCEKIIKAYGWNNWNNIILLTGEAKSDIATRMIQDGIINGYLYKGDEGYLDRLMEILAIGQNRYFSDKSDQFISAVSACRVSQGFNSSCLVDADFISLFGSIIKKHNIIEYYLIDDSGSYLLLNSEGKIIWLIVKCEDDMKADEYELSMDDTVPCELLRAVEERKALRYFFTEWKFPIVKESSEWSKYIYPAEILKGRANYYYSIVENPLPETFIDVKKIVSYNDFISQNDE